MKLEDKVAVITGGSKGIGLGCARVFARHGCTVVLGARGEEAGREAEQELAAAGYRAVFVPCDVTREADMRALIDGAVERCGRLDALVNNAGWHPPTMSIDETSVEDFEGLVRLNLTSTFMGCKFAVPHLRRTRDSIINMSSEVALIGQGQAPSYVATKAGQLGLTRALALDLAERIEKLGALVPPPRVHLIRYHGVLAPNAADRALIVPGPETTEDAAPAGTPPAPVSRRQRLAWAALLARVWGLDVTVCPRCGGRMQWVAALTDPDSVRTYLTRVGRPADPPVIAPARPPPQPELEFTA